MADATTAQPNSGGFDLGGFLSSLAAAGIDIYSLAKNVPGSTANTAANIADPLQPIKSDQLSQFQAFLKNPGSVLNDPGFVAAENVGAENVARLGGAGGMGSSGNLMADLFKYGQTSALGFEQQKFQNFMSILRPNVAGANAYTQGKQQQGGTIADLIKALLGGSAGSGVVGLLPAILKGLGINFGGTGTGGGDTGAFDVGGSSGFGGSTPIISGGDTGAFDIGGSSGFGGIDLGDLGSLGFFDP
jgi:hypothetical protein